MAWLTLAVLAGTPAYEAAQHAVAVCSCLRSEGPCASVGAAGLRWVFSCRRHGRQKPGRQAERRSDYPHEPGDVLAARAIRENAMLTEALLADQSEFADYLKE